MRVRLVSCRSSDKAKKLLNSLGHVIPAWHDLPCAIGQERPEPCAPGPGGQPCLYALVLKPRGRPGGWELALQAAWVLEERAGAELNWAWSVRESGAVWLLICPWAVKRGRRRWYWPGSGDLEALRELGARWDRPGEDRN
jgi:hypothetical protein